MPPSSSADGQVGILLQHINEYLAILPLVTVSTLVITVASGLIDFILNIFGTDRLVWWLDLSYPNIRHNYQVYRIITYPFVTASLSLLLTNLLFLVPFLLQFENKHGTFPTLWTLLVVGTLLPALAYIGGAWLLHTTLIDPWKYAGLSGWVIVLSVWTAVEEYRTGDAPDRMLFGVVRVPSRYLPIIVFSFYMLLAPGSSWILHSAAAAISYLVASRSAPFTPSQEAYHRLEASPAFSPLTSARGFVSVHQDRAFLPIFRRSIIIEDDNGSPSSDQEFPGQGRRLGGTT